MGRAREGYCGTRRGRESMELCVGASPSHLAASSGCVGGKSNYGGCGVASSVHTSYVAGVSISLVAPWRWLLHAYVWLDRGMGWGISCVM